ncbi:hypothetical protein [uncultured Amnibacterium sp.]|uniref:hypothetical protein n=1 Tax=uncultured Amnibacterium sp. TaxID=1631851 RepID=UPI0035CAAAA1
MDSFPTSPVTIAGLQQLIDLETLTAHPGLPVATVQHWRARRLGPPAEGLKLRSEDEGPPASVAWGAESVPQESIRVHGPSHACSMQICHYLLDHATLDTWMPQ